MKESRAIFIAIVCVSACAIHSPAQESKPPAPNAPPAVSRAPKPGREYSGMYTFLKEGEFLQITVEEEGKVTGFLSRYGEGDNEKDAFLEQYFRSGKLESNKLTFTTETKQLEWFEFKGTIERGEGKNPDDEAYYLLKGTLTDNTSDGAKKVNAHSQDVVFKRFPEEASKN